MAETPLRFRFKTLNRTRIRLSASVQLSPYRGLTLRRLYPSEKSPFVVVFFRVYLTVYLGDSAVSGGLF